MKSWILQSLREKRKAFHQNVKQDHPLGRIPWSGCKATEGKYSCNENEAKELTFTSCGDGKFTCDSGHCVDSLG